jgi:ACS family tartrate transporter-like MFS transporter
MTEPPQLDGDRLYTKVAWRIIPFMFLLYIIAFLDRANVGYAALEFQSELKFKDTAYGFGAGIFFVGYFLFEVPSNLILNRVGARMWIARIMISWGIVSSSFMFMWDEYSFYCLRFLLGVTEAGFFPGLILYLTYWFPVRMRARMVSRFMAAIPVSYIIGAPLSGLLMEHMTGVGGMSGWRWMFLLEGLPAVVMGVVVLFYLTDRPAKAHWLGEGERAWLEANLEADRARIADGGRKDLRAAFTDYRVFWLVALYLTNVIANYGLGLWVPKIIKASSAGMSSLTASFLTMIPWIVTGIVMMTNGWHSDRMNERRWHIAGPHLVAALALFASLAYLDNPLILIICLSVTLAGVNSALGPFWALPASFLTGAAAAGGIAVINSIGNLGGYVGPDTVGRLKEAYGYGGGFIAIACSLIVGAILVLLFPLKKQQG